MFKLYFFFTSNHTSHSISFWFVNNQHLIQTILCCAGTIRVKIFEYFSVVTFRILEEEEEAAAAIHLK